MTNIVLYARYSTDQQNHKSVDDQILLCKAFIEKNFPDAIICGIFSDIAISGADNNRAGVQAMLEFARNKSNKINYIIAEDIDRISRSISFIGYLYEICEYHAIKMHTVNEGEINELHIGFKGTMNALHLKVIKQKTARGHMARAREGRIVGIRYGYRVAPRIDERGHVHKGYREIVPHEAEIVKMIYTDFANGLSKNGIAIKLNNLKVPAPNKGTHWRVANLLGVLERKEGILACDLYRGIYQYNRTTTKKNPTTGKSHHEIKPETDWVVRSVPDLQIIDEDLWQRVQHQLIQEANKPKNQIHNKLVMARTRTTYPLTHLIFCGVCQSHCTRAHETRYTCSAFRLRRSICRNTRSIKENVIMDNVVYHINETINSRIMYNEIQNYYNNFGQKLENLIIELEKNQKELDNLYEMFTLGLKKDTFSINKMNDLMNNVRHLTANIEYEKNLLVFKNTTYSDIKDYIEIIKIKLNQDYTDNSLHNPIKKIIECFVEKIILNPILEKKEGSKIIIIPKAKPNYLDFYLASKSIW